MLSYEDFYEFSSNFSATKYHAYLIGENSVKDAEKKLLTCDFEWVKPPLLFRHERQHKAFDVLVSGAPYFFLISTRLKTVLEENKLTGWKTIQIKLFDKNDDEITGYYGFCISGRCGPVDFSKCTVVKRKYVESGPIVKDYIGLPIGLDQWDGSDFFLPARRLSTIITPKAADVLLKNKVSNLALTSLADIVIPECSLKILGLI